MTKPGSARPRHPSRVALVCINLLLALFGFFLLDFCVSSTNLIYKLIPNSFRIHDARLHHNLAKNVSDGIATWGTYRYPMFTNSLGYRDYAARQIPLQSTRTRVVFMGDSFTEAVGVPWEKSFVGLFQAHHPELDVLNGGLMSYDQSMYWKKTAYLLEEGYKIDHVFIYVDVSDVQNQAGYKFDDAGNIVESDYTINTFARLGDPPSTIQRLKPAVVRSGFSRFLKKVQIYLAERFVVSKALSVLIKRWIQHDFVSTSAADELAGAQEEVVNGHNCRATVFCRVRSMWTIDGDKLTAGYGNLGVEGAISKGIHDMDELAALLRSRGIKFAVGVYPWPDQVEFDTAQSRQVQIWQSWCERNGCEKFINHFPDFFEVKRTQKNWLDQLYIRDDIHFNEGGNRLVGERLIKDTEDIFGPGK